MNKAKPLPQGWQSVSLGKVCDIIMGQSPPGHTYNKNGKGLAFLQGKIDFGKLYPTPSTWCSEPKKIAEPGDILICVRAPVGPTNLCSEKCCVGRGLAAIRATDSVEYLFILYHLRLIENEISETGQGSTFGAIKRERLQTIEIPLPPILEQKRIAAKIQELMEEVEHAHTTCEAQLETARALPQAYLRQFFESEEAKNWKKRKLGDVCEAVTGNTPSKDVREYYGDYLPWVKLVSFRVAQ